jgi:hypothetical protein
MEARIATSSIQPESQKAEKRFPSHHIYSESFSRGLKSVNLTAKTHMLS